MIRFGEFTCASVKVHSHFNETNEKVWCVRILAHHSFIADMNLILISLIQKKCRKKENKFDDICGMRSGHTETMFLSPPGFIVLLSTRNPEFGILNLLGIKTVFPIWICSNARPHA